MNERNIEYINKSNPGRAIRIANNKLSTKQILLKNNTPTAVLYATIEHTRTLENFNWDLLPESFVIKPNQGSGGEGIIVIKKKRG